MKAILNKFQDEINEVVTELNALEVQIKSHFERHVALSAKMVGLFNELQEVAQKKFDLPMCETSTVVPTEAEEIARRKRFRNLGDGVVLSESVVAKVKRNDIDDYGYWIPTNLPPCITYSSTSKKYTWARNGESFTFTLPKGYRLLSIGEIYERGNSFTSYGGEAWREYTGNPLSVTESTYPMRGKIDE